MTTADAGGNAVTAYKKRRCSRRVITRQNTAHLSDQDGIQSHCRRDQRIMNTSGQCGNLSNP